MPVIINDFEITVEPPDSAAAADQAPPGRAEPAPGLRPEDVERIQRHFAERRRRLWAD